MGNVYIGVNGVARRVKSVYIGVNGIARKVKDLNIGINGVARMGYQAQKLTNVAGLLYDEGAVGNGTGGWENATSSLQSSTYKQMKAVFDENQIVLRISKRGYYCAIRTKRAFDLTGYRYIRVTFTQPVVGWGVHLSLAIIPEEEGQGIHIYTKELDDTNGEALGSSSFNYTCAGRIHIELFSLTSNSTDGLINISKIELIR